MTAKDLKEFILDNHYKQIGFTNKDSNYSLKKQKRRFSITCY